MEIGSLPSLVTALPGRASDLRFQLKVLREAGVLAPQRPDRTARVVKTLVTQGTTPASAIAVSAIKFPDRTFIVDETGELTFEQVHRRTNALANSMREMGIRDGDAVGIMCRNHRGIFEATLAASKLGVTALFLNTMFSGPQLVEVIEREGPTALIFDEEFSNLLEGVPEDVMRITAWSDETPEGPNLDRMIATGSRDDLAKPKSDSRFIILTSGTTGTPKGAQRNSPKGLAGIAGLLHEIPYRSGQTMVVAAPLFHSWGFINSVFALTLGCTIVLDRRFDPETVLRRIEQHKADVLIAVPVMLLRITSLDSELTAKYDVGNLKIVSLSGSALPGGLALEWMDRFGDNIYNMYGSTEVAFASVAGPADLRRNPSTAGRPPRGTSIRLVDEEGRDVPQGVTGRIFVNNSMTFEGYTGGGNKDNLGDYISSGDVGHLNSDGLLFIDGRDDEMIISGGENIFPGEVEDLITGHELVIESAVIGVKDDEFGQTLKAFVVLTAGAELDEGDVKAHVKANLASYKAPKEVVFLDALPRNATGKVLKRSLA